MSEQFGLFLCYFARNRYISKELTRPWKREDIGAAVFAPISAIECFEPGVRENRDGYRAPSRPGGNARKPLPQSFRATVLSTFLDHAHGEAQTCPPFPENDS